MKILIVSHRFPPHGTAGTETYTADLGAALVARGHAVHVFAAVKDIGRTDLEVLERDHRGMAVHEVVNNLYHADFRETWDHPRIERTFDDLLTRVSPDVVHFQHLMYLSAGCVEAARRRGIPVLFTLHDYWLQCPRFGQRLHPDGGLCDTIDFARCGTCLPSFEYRQSAARRRVGTAIASVRSATGIDLGGVARSAARKSRAAGKEPWSAPPLEESAAMARAAEDRSRALKERVAAKVDLFIAPSRFLRERFVREWKIPPEKIEHLRFGVDLGFFDDVERTRSEKLRVAFLGSWIEVKGAHVLLEAWGRIAPDLRARGSLVLHGPAQHEPEYVARLEHLAREVGAQIGGPLERADVARALGSIDLLVVPSVWFENAPLVIHEALAARTPLLVSDLGGMAELVEEGRGGWRFPPGDVGALAQRLSDLLADRSALDALAQIQGASVRPPSFEVHAREVEARYRRLV